MSQEVIILSSEDEDDNLDSKLDKPLAQEIISTSYVENEIEDDIQILDDATYIESVNFECLKSESTQNILLNVGHNNQDPNLYFNSDMVSILKPHQIAGIRFMYHNIIGSLHNFNHTNGQGCLLAHCMGLGKTLQAIAFSDIFLRHTPGKLVLCLAPTSTIPNWLKEYDSWLLAPNRQVTMVDDQVLELDKMSDVDKSRRKINVYHLIDSEHKTLHLKMQVLSKWKNKGGVLIMGYELFRSLVTQMRSKKRKLTSLDIKAPYVDIAINNDLKDGLNIRSDFWRYLIDPGPDLIICDEGHRIKSQYASLSKVLKRVRTLRRIVLTGYPLQNNLIEYWSMIDFVRPGYLGCLPDFRSIFERPITGGQKSTASQLDSRVARIKSHVLHTLLERVVQRRDATLLKQSLPPKREYVLSVRLSPLQESLYRRLKSEHQSRDYGSGYLATADLAGGFGRVDDVTNLGMSYNTTGARINGTGADYTSYGTSRHGSHLALFAAALKIFNHPHVGDSRKDVPPPIDTNHESKLSKDPNLPEEVQSGKVEMFLRILEETISRGEKLLLFSQSVLTLDYLEKVLARTDLKIKNLQRQVDEGQANPLASTTPEPRNIRMVRNGNYFRLDGSTPYSDRESSIRLFNTKRVSKARNKILKAKNSPVSIDNQSSNHKDGSTPTSLSDSRTLETMCQKSPSMDDEGNSEAPLVGSIAGGNDLSPSRFVTNGDESHTNPESTSGSLVENVAEKDDMAPFLPLNDARKPPPPGLRTLRPSSRAVREEQPDHGAAYSSSGSSDDEPESLSSDRTYCSSDSSIQVSAGRAVPPLKGSGRKMLPTLSSDEDEGDLGASHLPRECKMDQQLPDDEKIKEYHLFLLSTRAGSLGINLTAASRVIIFDASWNPCHDVQALARVYRMGQTRPCTVYRFVCHRTLESHVFRKQLHKQNLSNVVVDKTETRSHKNHPNGFKDSSDNESSADDLERRGWKRKLLGNYRPLVQNSRPSIIPPTFNVNNIRGYRPLHPGTVVIPRNNNNRAGPSELITLVSSSSSSSSSSSTSSEKGGCVEDVLIDATLTDHLGSDSDGIEILQAPPPTTPHPSRVENMGGTDAHRPIASSKQLNPSFRISARTSDPQAPSLHTHPDLSTPSKNTAPKKGFESSKIEDELLASICSEPDGVGQTWLALAPWLRPDEMAAVEQASLNERPKGAHPSIPGQISQYAPPQKVALTQQELFIARRILDSYKSDKNNNINSTLPSGIGRFVGARVPTNDNSHAPYLTRH